MTFIIQTLRSTDPAFTQIDFKLGLNLVLATRNNASIKTQSRNARGKTTLFQFVNYLYGSDFPPELAPLGESEWSLIAEGLLYGFPIEIKRSLTAGQRSSVHITHLGDEERYPSYLPKGEVHLDYWRQVLNSALFDTSHREVEQRAAPSFRASIARFLRTNPVKLPFKTVDAEARTKSDFVTSFLLGLDSAKIGKIAELDTVAKMLDSYRAVVSGSGSQTFAPLNILEARLLELEEQVAELEDRISQVEFSEQLPDIDTKKAAEAASTLSQLYDQQFADQLRLSEFTKSLDSLADGASTETNIVEILEEAGLIFTNPAARTIEESAEYYRTLRKNRIDLTKSQIKLLKNRISEREIEIASLAKIDRANRLTLHAQRDLNAMKVLQDELNGVLRDRDSVVSQINTYGSAELESKETKREKKSLIATIKEELPRSDALVDIVNQEMARIANEVYGHKIKVKAASDPQNGYKFSLESSKRSTGVDRANVLFFDLALMVARAKAGLGPRCLGHDSPLLDGIDGHQVALYLLYAQELLDDVNKEHPSTPLQYFVTLNDNSIDTTEIPDSDVISEAIVRTIRPEEVGGVTGISF